jgi:hypothetical protein
MLDINHPPQGPEDITLSESGKVLLKIASKEGLPPRDKSNWDTMNALGMAACSEIIDACGGAEEISRNNNDRFYLEIAREALVEVAETLNNRDLHAYLGGMQNYLLEMSRPHEVAA